MRKCQLRKYVSHEICISRKYVILCIHYYIFVLQIYCNIINLCYTIFALYYIRCFPLYKIQRVWFYIVLYVSCSMINTVITVRKPYTVIFILGHLYCSCKLMILYVIICVVWEACWNFYFVRCVAQVKVWQTILIFSKKYNVTVNTIITTLKSYIVVSTLDF